MNPFKCILSGHSWRKSKSTKVGVKQESGIKEEPNNDGSVIDLPRPRVDGRYRVNYEGPFDFDYDFDVLKDEIKCEEEEVDEEKSSAPCERSNDSAANDDNNEELMGDVIDVQQPQPVGSGNERNASSKGRNKRAIPRNQVAKNQKKHKCHVCNHMASNKFNLKVHLRIHTGEKPYQCDVCLKSFAGKFDLNRHKKMHGQFRCSKCNQGFEQESFKIDHERSCSPRRLECDICGYSGIQKSNLRTHMQIHTGGKPFKCSICCKSFTANAHLRNHSMAHKAELPDACSKCGRRFATLEDKQTHELRCQRKLIECGICSKQFVQQIKLKQHLSSKHSDQFPFQCCKCFGGYATEDEKAAHEDSCGFRQYQCYLCKEYRREKQDLEIHMRKDHTGERIQCRVCAASFCNRSNANQHMKTVHHSKK
ncbi:zinc finger protein OZF-like [Sitodiplosis mosellana]|uniref:zinc finger protein OZF-like n=1 Tax=Sitodiplosis mosellana TaxID=263140 RepID=UPI002443EE50|nr:zinc finger protein OZF-like [Sitodiplosis mosellana]